MVSFFRRKKPADASPATPGTDPTRRYSLEELAAAFPGQAERGPAESAAPPAMPGSGPVTGAGPLVIEVPAAAEVTPVVAMPPQAEPAVAEHSPLLSPVPLPAPPAPADAATAGKTGWRERLRGTGFARGLSGLFSRNPKLDDDLLDEIETALLTADVGVPATTALVEGLRKRMKAREFADAQALLKALRADLIALLAPVALPLRIDTVARPFVVLTVGVNGVGKTTTIGKLARRFKEEGHSLMLAAGDTFRAA
ncbi:MAG: signal recognition particle-docking protein FtsY, partial [Lysobacteraceae bacterium]